MKAIKDPQEAAKVVTSTFEDILQESMKDVPILNNRLQVETLGFQMYENRIMGIVITPWLMNLVMLPNDEDDWSELELGKKQPIEILGRTYKFMVNEVEGIGKCKTHSLYSPMHEFNSHNHALKVARDFLEDLMTERQPTVEELVDEDLVDEDLLGKIMRGEEVKVDLDQFAVIEPHSSAEASKKQPDSISNATTSTLKERVKKPMSRRDLLRGKFLTG
jgi:[NiFe] hydrogenase assembly HybE family chaperone